jgi:hypothetical protein
LASEKIRVEINSRHIEGLTIQGFVPESKLVVDSNEHEYSAVVIYIDPRLGKGTVIGALEEAIQYVRNDYVWMGFTEDLHRP